MRHTFYYKDHCRIYWRIECVLDEKQGNWDYSVFRSLEDHDDPEAHEVFHGSQENLSGKPDVDEIVGDMIKYYLKVSFSMCKNIETAYEAKIEPDQPISWETKLAAFKAALSETTS